MSSIKSGLNANFFNKSELIREVARAVPGATNKQVKKIIRDQYGIEVASNLVIAVLGKERTRKLLAPVRSRLVQLGLEWFELCGRDRGYCSELLNSFI
jgi:nucleoside diphosphate kinase